MPLDTPTVRSRHAAFMSQGGHLRAVDVLSDIPLLCDEVERLSAIVEKVLALYGPASEVPVDPELLLRWFASAKPDPILSALTEYHAALAAIVGLRLSPEDHSSRWLENLGKAVEIARIALTTCGAPSPEGKETARG